MSDETPKARQAYADYLALGPDRSLDKLLSSYLERVRSGAAAVPTRRLNTLKEWSAQHGWQARIAAFVDEQRAQREAQILASGYALTANRVELLDELAGTLRTELAGGALYVTDYRGVGSGEDFELVPVKKPSATFLRELRGLLDDIAQETGGRVKRTELSGPDKGPVEVADATPATERAALLAAIAAAARTE